MNRFSVKFRLCMLLSCVSFLSRSQTITTFAGDGTAGFYGDGGQATAAELLLPYDVAIDSSGNLYIADSFNNRIRKVSTGGIISTFAGNGYGSPVSGGYSGDGGQASTAELYYPNGVALDSFGNIYISDFKNERIRKVNITGIINTLAGNGIQSYSGDGGFATAAEINGPTGVSADASGNVYIADYYNNRIRIVNSFGIINTLAGNGTSGFSGDGGAATAAELYQPSGITPDALGNIYIADYDNSRIRIVNTTGTINTFAGNGTAGYSGDGGPATAAELNRPANTIFDASGNLYMADYNNNRIREITTSGIISTIGGIDTAGYSGDGGPATAAELNNPTAVAVDASGNLYIADWYNNRIRKVAPKLSSINNLLSASNDVTIYPLPTSGILTVTGVKEGLVIEIYNCTGQKILSVISHQSYAKFDISNSASGIYLIRVLSKDGSIVATKKILKTE